MVVGAGVVGLAIARRLAERGLTPLVLDEEQSFGTATSSRNSEVVHAGIYYPAGTLKGKLCVRGRSLLYEYCEQFRVPIKRVGKLIIANEASQEPGLDQIEECAEAAGVTDLVRLRGNDARGIEPSLRCSAAILSPSTGIIDSHAYMSSLLAHVEDLGGTFVARARVTRISGGGGSWGVHVDGSPEPVLFADLVVNSAGLNSAKIAAVIDGLNPSFIPRVRYARGTYFAYNGRVPFSRLIYPLPVPGGLGTHLTLDMAGGARFGPDVEWIDNIDYEVHAEKHEEFVCAARKIWAELDPLRLQPGYAGIRPKLSGPGEPAADFVISGPEEHSLEGLVNLFGIESPGLTASLAIAEVVGYTLQGRPSL